jgi:GT2 family glycosyltransferase
MSVRRNHMSAPLIQCVVVLYKCTFSESRTVQSLLQCCREDKDIAEQLSILFYDNSPVAQELDATAWPSMRIAYQHPAENGGLAAAYNEALAVAREQHIEWLLLLDQDTLLYSAFFHALSAATRNPPAEICAIVPKLVQEGKLITPQVVRFFQNRYLPGGFSGVYPTKITAMNSAACLRVQAMVDMGGFPAKYWLDYLDHVVFYWLQAAGGKVLILDIAIEHRLSLKNMEAEMSLTRHANVLAAEWMFVRETRSGGGPLTHRLRLIKRALVYAITIKNKAYTWQTLRAALRAN